MNAIDRRINAWREDLADSRLRGAVEVARFADGRAARVIVPVLDMLSAPDASAGLSTQLLFGDDVLVFEDRDGWAWAQTARDSYVGYLRSDAVADPGPAATHVVAAPRTFVYRDADLKHPRMRCLSMGSRLAVVGASETRGARYALLASGEALIADHLQPIDVHAADYVAVAERLVGTPYLWGGSTAFGIDCSGLVQLSMLMAGRRVLRDSDMQAATIGQPIDEASGLRRGDLVFWKGHVAIVADGGTIIHANGHTMSVACESLAAAVERIAYLYSRPTGFRRP